MTSTVSVVTGDADDVLSAKIYAWSWIDVQIIWPVGNQQLEISNTWVIEITSSDSSIDVEDLGGGVRDIKWCCSDTKVKATGNDTTPWYITNKISVASPLTMTLQNTGANEYYQLGLNVGLLSIPNNKVAVKSSCAEWYLEDVIIVGTGLSKSTVWCDVKIDIDTNAAMWKRPLARRTMTQTFTKTLTIGTNNAWAVLDFSSPYFAAWSSIANDSAMTSTYPEVLYITKTGYYKLFVNGTVEVNDAIAAFRVYMINTGTSWAYPLDIRYGWPTSTGTYWSWNSWSLGKRAQRFNCSWFNMIYLNAWDILAPAIKASAEVSTVWDAAFDGWAIKSASGQFRILATWDSIDDSWFSYGVEFIWNIV